MPTSHIRFRVNIKFQLQKSALNISSKLQIQTSTSTAKVIFKVNFKLSLKNSTKSNFNFKVKLQLQSQTLMSNIKLQSQTSDFDKLSLHNVWKVNEDIIKYKGKDGRTEWHGHYMSCSSQLKMHVFYFTTRNLCLVLPNFNRCIFSLQNKFRSQCIWESLLRLFLLEARGVNLNSFTWGTFCILDPGYFVALLQNGHPPSKEGESPS